MRPWHEFVAAVVDLVPGGMPVLALILLVLTAVVALLWYWWPEWWHALRRGGARGKGRGERQRRRWRFRGLWGRMRARWRLGWRRRRGAPAEAEEEPELAPDELPDLPAVALALSADELAAQGRYKEAVRERLRAIVRELVERQVVDYRPGWTVTELAAMAARTRPPAAAPLAAASEIFSSIWYGQRDATAAHDAAMRVHADQVRAVLTERVPA
jgi:Domain of unknown function (DUF4129)